MKKVSTTIIGVVIVGSLLVGYWGYQKYFKAEEAELLTFPVLRQDLSETVRVRGEVATQETFDLEFPFSGRVEKILVQEGQTVKAGDPLIQLETTEFRLELQRLSAQRAQAEAAVMAAMASLQQYQSEVEAQLARLDELKRGTRPEEILVAETKVTNTQKHLSDTELELLNTQQKNETALQTLVQQGRNVLPLAAVTAQKILSQHLQDIIYPIRFPRNKTCELQLSTFLSNEGEMRSMCFEALSAAEALEAQAQDLGTDHLQLLTKLQQAQQHLEKIRALLYQALGVVNGAIGIKNTNITNSITDAQLTALKTSITAGQAELERLMSETTTAIEQLQNQIILNKSELDTAQKNINQAENTLKTAEAELLLKQAAALPEQIVAQESEVKKAQANLSAQEARIRQARADVSAIDAQIRSVQEKIQQSTLTAFEDLKVVKVWIKQQEVFREGKPAISLASVHYKIQADVSELEIGNIRVSEVPEVLITLDAFPEKTLRGNVVQIEEQEINLDGDKYYRVNIQLEDPVEEIRSGMSADLNIILSKKEQVLTIPEIVIVERDGQSFTGVIDERTGETRSVPITTGISNGEFMEVVAGLEEGQTVFISTE